MEEKNENKKINNQALFIFGGIVLSIAVVVIGISYAWWSFSTSQQSVNKITSDCLKIEFTDENPINLTNAYPITDTEASRLTPYTFTIKNVCNLTINYIANLEVMNSTNRLSSGYIDLQVDSNPFKLLNTYTAADKSYYSPKTGETYTVAEKYVVGTGTLAANASKSYSLKLWIDEDVTINDDAMNKTFISKVTAMASLGSNNS